MCHDSTLGKTTPPPTPTPRNVVVANCLLIPVELALLFIQSVFILSALFI